MNITNVKHIDEAAPASAPKELIKPLEFNSFLEEEHGIAIASTGTTMKRCTMRNVCDTMNTGVNGDTDLLF